MKDALLEKIRIAFAGLISDSSNFKSRYWNETTFTFQVSGEEAVVEVPVEELFEFYNEHKNQLSDNDLIDLYGFLVNETILFEHNGY